MKKILLLAGLLLLLSPALGLAQDQSNAGKDARYDWSDVVQHPRLILRCFVAHSYINADPSHGDRSTPGNPRRVELIVDDGTGFGVSLEYRMSCLLGLEAGYLNTPLDSMFMFDSDTEWLMASDKMPTGFATLGLNFHLTPKKRVDLFLGPVLGFVDYGTVNYNLGGTIGPISDNLDEDFGIGLRAGIDVPFQKNGPWALTAGLHWFPSLDAKSVIRPLNVAVNPKIASLGLAYRFGRDKGPRCGEPKLLPPPPPPPAPAPEPEAAPAPPPPPPPPPPAPAPKPEIRETVNFDSGSARLSNIAKAKLDDVALQMKQDPELDALVIGYTDSTGSASGNQVLSEKRAQAVKDYLVTRHGIDSTRITIEGHGAENPVADNATAEGRKENRRAVIILSAE